MEYYQAGPSAKVQMGLVWEMRRLVVGTVRSLGRGVVGSRLENPSYKILTIIEALLNEAWGDNDRGGHEVVTDKNRTQDAEWCD